MNDQPEEPSIETLLELHRSLSAAGVMTLLPGQITDYDATSQRASVQPLTKTRRFTEDDSLETVSTPIVHDCPVMFLGPARGRITTPVAVGDPCALWFFGKSAARWKETGGEVDPGDDRTHDISDGMCIIGLHDFAHVPTDAPTDAVVIHASGGVSIKLGSSAASKAPAWNDDLAQLVSTLTTGITPGPGAGDAAINALLTFISTHPTFPVGPTKTKVE